MRSKIYSRWTPQSKCNRVKHERPVVAQLGDGLACSVSPTRTDHGPVRVNRLPVLEGMLKRSTGGSCLCSVWAALDGDDGQLTWATLLPDIRLDFPDGGQRHGTEDVGVGGNNVRATSFPLRCVKTAQLVRLMGNPMPRLLPLLASVVKTLNRQLSMVRQDNEPIRTKLTD